MGTLTFQQLMTEVKRHMGNRTDLGAPTDVSSTLGIYVNLAQVRVARSVHTGFEELQSAGTLTFAYTGVAATDKIVAAPTGLRNFISFRVIDDSSSQKLTYYPPKEFDKKIPYPEWYTTGRPSIYTRYQEKLELFRIPDQEYSAPYRANLWPTPLSTLGTASDLDNKDDILITLAASMLHTALGQEDRGAKLWGIYRNMAEQAYGDDLIQPDAEIVNKDVNEGFLSTGEAWLDPFVRSDS